MPSIKYVDNRANKQVTLSIVCAVWNASKCIEGLLDSCRKQKNDFVEFIFIDADSNDGTWEIIKNAGNIVSYAVSEPDSGIYDAWNKSIALCLGNYISFIGADDLIADGALNYLVDFCKTHHDQYQMIAGYNVLTNSGVPIKLLGAPYSSDALVRRMMTAHVLCAHQLSWLKEIGGFDSSFRSSGDYELMLRTRKSLKIKTLNHIFAFMADGGTSSRNSFRPFIEDFRARKNNSISLLMCILLFIKAIFGSFYRKFQAKLK